MLTAIHDADRLTFEFQVNGKSLGIVFRKILPKNLYLVADFSVIGEVDDELSIIDRF
jgi:hypothetical protein